MGPNPPVISGYRDLVFVGRGGFASVYRARQIAFDRDVALKVIDETPGDGRDAEKFTRECRAIGSLSWHPHVVPVYDAGLTESGSSYLAMELLPGGSLADAVAGGPMDVAEAVRHVHDVADALAAAHEIEVLHRDVKPANILLDRRGRARLADFGIARTAGSGPTTTGVVTGTIAYMAPEVLAGSRASTASDVYALGLTLATLLEGRNPYVEDSDDTPFAVLSRVLGDGGPALTRVVPVGLAEVVAACTAREPGDRPGSAAALRDALADLDLGADRVPVVPLPTPPVSVSPPPPPPPPAEPTVPVGAQATVGWDGGPAAAAPAAHDDVTAALPVGPPPQVPPGPGGPSGPVPSSPRRRKGATAAVVAVVVALLAVVVAGATFLLGRGDDGDTATSTTSTTAPDRSTSSTTDETPAPSTPSATWEGAGDPSVDQQTLLDNATTMFAAADTCRPIDDLDDDPLNVYPQGPDLASIECRYGDAATIVFSLFSDDDAMAGFFADRLTSRGLARGTGTLGPTQPWQVDYADDPDRGTGSIFGTQRETAGGERSEIGFIRTGLSTYAYSFSVGTDFPTFYAWWSEIFGGPAPPG